ncbi:MAG: aminotransferase class IV, partial [Alphaproteobacteria bacterium]
VIGLAKKRGYTVNERAVWPNELAEFDEAFITGTAVEVTPVKEIGPHNYQVGPITRTLLKDFDDLVRVEVAARKSAAE